MKAPLGLFTSPSAWLLVVGDRRLFLAFSSVSMTDGQTDRYLASFCPLADKGFVHGCERGGVVVDVQQADEDGNAAALPRIICKHTQRETVTTISALLQPRAPCCDYEGALWRLV